MKIIIPYMDNAGTKFAVEEELGLESLLNDLFTTLSITPARVAPFGEVFENLAALNAVLDWESAPMAPAGLVLRKISIALSDSETAAPAGGIAAPLANVTLIVGDAPAHAKLEPTGLFPLPEQPQIMQSVVTQITGAIGESRNSN